MKNKLILFFLLVSYFGLSSCGKGTKPTVNFISDLKEESKTQAMDGSYIYSHLLNVGAVKLKNERKLKKSAVLAELKLYHLSGFKKQFEKNNDLKYRLFAGDSSEVVYPHMDTALMVSIGINATITDNAGKKIFATNDLPISTKVDASMIPSITDTSKGISKFILASEHNSTMVTLEKNIYYKNINIFILNNSSVFKKEQKYKLQFRVFDKLDPNRYFEGETLFTAY